MSVPPPKDIVPPPPSTAVDTLQELIARRKEYEANKLKYHLTEKDCSLICTNAAELHFSDGQVIANEGAQITSVYRIKCGRIALMKAGQKLFDLTTGYFIGEGLFIRGEAKDIFGAALVANGPVILSEVNLPFVRQMLDADKVLAFKIYRHMACKLSALLYAMVTKVSNETHSLSLASVLTRSDSISSTNSDSSLDSPLSSVSSTSSVDSSPSTPVHSNSSGSLTGSEKDMDYPPKAVIMSNDMISARARKTKKQKHCKITGPKPVAFKAYPLEGDHAGSQALLDTRKITITSGSKIRSNRKIKYNKILDMSKTGKNSVTIIYNVQAKTIFFKNEADLNEFYGLFQSLIVSNAKQQALEANPAPPGSPSVVRPNPLTPHPDEEAQHQADKLDIHKLAVRQDLVKGDVVVAEGDLYQRVYTIVSGELHMKRGDRTLVTMQEGEVFGVLTLFHLRPSMLTIDVASDTATLLVIPFYRIQELISTNFPLAVRMHKKSAQLVYGQIEKVLMSREGVVKGFSDPM